MLQVIRLLRRPWSLLGPHQVGAPPPTTAPAPSPAPGHPGHHLHHPGHHSHHPGRHLHHPGPQEEGRSGRPRTSRTTGQPGLHLSSTFCSTFKPSTPPPSPRPPSGNLDTQDTLILTGATPPLLDAPRLPPHFLLADIPAEEKPDTEIDEELAEVREQGRRGSVAPPSLLYLLLPPPSSSFSSSTFSSSSSSSPRGC